MQKNSVCIPAYAQLWGTKYAQGVYSWLKVYYGLYNYVNELSCGYSGMSTMFLRLNVTIIQGDLHCRLGGFLC